MQIYCRVTTTSPQHNHTKYTNANKGNKHYRRTNYSRQCDIVFIILDNIYWNDLVCHIYVNKWRSDVYMIPFGHGMIHINSPKIKIFKDRSLNSVGLANFVYRPSGCTDWHALASFLNKLNYWRRQEVGWNWLPHVFVFRKRYVLREDFVFLIYLHILQTVIKLFTPCLLYLTSICFKDE